MRLSQLLFPTLRDDPKEAQVVSHRLMLRAGMIRQNVAGIYTWLPMGLRVLRKIEGIVREEMAAIGCGELLMPTLQPAELWQESGRYDSYGKEMLRIKDRHERDLLYGPTNEEMITALVRDCKPSYRDMPKLAYHIQWKFRDEIRPRFGVMRGREFLMKDAYSFAADKAGAEAAYESFFMAYLKIFSRLGVTAVPVRAATGPIGGDLSHEFHILAETGESQVYVDKAYFAENVNELMFTKAKGYYAAADELHDPSQCPIPPEQLATKRGIEVGHIFYFGTKYSAAMGATVTVANAQSVPLEMGAYGIGVSRLVGALIEAHHDAGGIRWPVSVAPYRLAIVAAKPDDEDSVSKAEQIYRNLSQLDGDVLFDDRPERMGTKLADLELLGIPHVFVVGPKGLENGMVDWKERASGKTTAVPLAGLEHLYAHF
ncbi:MAG: proline--tRNA ligase [Alphaproteobacteria bacterium]|jgi:prolyl-tRNA synthetase|nr:proline--tRNA ligase [Thalassospira sp.]MCE2965143.1 proline--tRNA ligase [Alphaproteobacteria bacterium]